ncbi:MAG: 6-phosphogluconolactonase [Gammaproteobacteria bacterium]|nr:6-phosphogluconolactonase [Gammaproteobacteria bacterium]
MAASVQAGLDAHGTASLAVAGGRTPIPILEALAITPLNWSRVSITLTDERWVDEQHRDSNAALVRRHLLHDDAASARFVPLFNGAESAVDGTADCQATLADFPLPFDVVLLGMGEDGHIASLFPGINALADGAADEPGRHCIAVTPSTAPHERMSLTVSMLLRARLLVLMVTGERKWEVLQQALQPGPAMDLPVRTVLHQTTAPLAIYWAPA